MISKPDKCCAPGEYACQVPMPLKGRINYIDLCIADIVAALNAANIQTEASCCGHRKWHGSIMLADGREIIIYRGENKKMKAVRDYKGLQTLLAQWQKENFDEPNDRAQLQLTLGVCEESGELAHAILKEDQGIRKDQDLAALAEDAIGDICVYLMQLCTIRKLDFFEIIWNVSQKVMERKREDQICRKKEEE